MSAFSRRAALLLVALLGFSIPASAGIFGDVEADCDIDVADALLLERYLAGLATLTTEQSTNASIAPIGGARDSVVEIGDLLTLKRILAGDVTKPVAAFNPPTITTITGTNPVEISGTAQTGVPGLEIILYVNGRPLPYASAVNVGTGAFDFGVGAGDEADVPLVDGDNRITVMARVGTSHSCSSAAQTRTYHPAAQLAGADLNFANDLVNSNPTHAATMVWTPELSNGQTFNVTSTVTILSGQSLFIQPGVQVKFAQNAKLIVGVGGRLKIFGAPGQMVELAPNGTCGSTTRWGGIEVATNVVPPTHIEYARIKCVTTGLRVYDTDANGVAVGPIPGGQATLNFSEIDDFTQKGIYVEHMSVVSVGASFNKIIGNGNQAVGVDAHDNSTTLRGNTIEARGSNSIGIRTFTTGPQTRSVSIERNVITRSSKAGIEINISDDNPDPFAPLHNSTVFSQNTVTQNCRGVILNATGEGPEPKFIGNSIFNNNHECASSQDQRPSKDFTYDDNGTYGYECGSLTPAGRIDATGNWWGSTDPAFIASRIDQLPFCPGLIDYTPFLSAPHDQSGGYWIGLPHSALITGNVDDVTNPPPAAGTDWVIAGTATIPSGRTWTIPDGQVLKFARHSKLVVQGALVVQDLNLADVTFTGLVPPGTTSAIGDWSGIVIEPSTAAAPAGTATIDDALFRYAAKAVSTTSPATARAHVNILDSKFELFSSKGVVLDRVTSTSQIANTIFDGTITASPLLTLKDGAQQNVTGVQIVDLTTPTGCAPTCVKVTNSTIQRLVTGIHVRGAAKPEISNNTIKENIWGIWLEGEGTGQPNPVIKNNKIHANTGLTPSPLQEPIEYRFCTNASSVAGSNLCLSDYTTTGAATLIDAKRNYWGVLTNDGVRASVTTTEGERASVNVSEFLNATNGVVGPADLLSAIFVTIDAVGAAGFTGGPVIRPTVVAGEDLDISYRLHRIADVRVEVFNEADDTTTATPLRTYNIEDQAAGGPYTLSWDGKNSSAQWVNDGAYTFVLTARHPSSGAVLDRYDPARNHGLFVPNNLSIVGDRSSGKARSGYGDINSPLPPLPPYNSFKNDYLTYDYGLEISADRGVPFSSRVTANIIKRENLEQLCDPQNGQGKVIARPWVDKPLWIGQHNFLWDGRADSFVDPTTGFVPGELVPGGDVGFPDFCLFFGVPAPLKPNHVIVSRARPTLTGPGTAPEIEIKSDPYVVHPSYDQSSALTFKVDQSANVTLHILAPGDLNLANALSSIPIDGNDNPADGVQPVPANTLRTYFWKGHPDTPGDSNLLAAAYDGAYTFALEAKSTQQANLTSLYRGVINVRGEMEER